MAPNKSLPLAEALVYYAYVILTLGFVWVIKVVIKKAVQEAHN